MLLNLCQRTEADFSCITREIRSVQEFLNRQISNPGPYSQKISQWLANTELRLSAGRSSRNKFDLEKVRKQWVGSLRDRLGQRFPNVQLFDDLAVLFEPSKLPLPRLDAERMNDTDDGLDLGDYGCAALNNVLTVFGVDKELSDGTKLPALVNPTKCKEEWLAVRKHFVNKIPELKAEKLARGQAGSTERKRKRRCANEEKEAKARSELLMNDVFEDIESTEQTHDHTSSDGTVRVFMSDIICQFLNDSIAKDNLNFARLANIALTLPVVTADCERGFSVMNSIKTESRNRLLSHHLDRLMRITIEGPKLADLQTRELAMRWHSARRRRVAFCSPTAIIEQPDEGMPMQ